MIKLYLEVYMDTGQVLDINSLYLEVSRKNVSMHTRLVCLETFLYFKVA